MASLLEALEEYAEVNLVCERLPRPEYDTLGTTLCQQWEDFRATLTEKQIRELDAILREESNFRRMEDSAFFRAAIFTGLELSRL